MAFHRPLFLALCVSIVCFVQVHANTKKHDKTGNSHVRFPDGWKTAAERDQIYGWESFLERGLYTENMEEPTICSNKYDYSRSNSTTDMYEYMICPTPEQNGTFNRCCGAKYLQECCNIADVGGILAIIVAMIVLILVCCCCTCCGVAAYFLLYLPKQRNNTQLFQPPPASGFGAQPPPPAYSGYTPQPYGGQQQFGGPQHGGQQPHGGGPPQYGGHIPSSPTPQGTPVSPTPSAEPIYPSLPSSPGYGPKRT